MVNGALCIRTAVISSAVTGPEAALEDPVFDEDAGVPLGGALVLAVDPFTSFSDGFVSWFNKIMKDFNNNRKTLKLKSFVKKNYLTSF